MTLVKGDASNLIREYQANLNKYFNAKVLEEDGIFGAATETFTKKFQAENGLVPDGIAGPLTLRAIAEENSMISVPVVTSDSDARYEKLHAVAKGQLGQKEIYGDQDNPQIVQYFSATSYGKTHDETPWCAAFVGWCLKQIGEKGTNSAAAASYDHWGKKLDKPIQGCIVCIEHLDEHGKKNGRRHVTTFDRFDSEPGYVWLLGGNQGNKVCSVKYNEQEVNSYRGFA
jgi:uncharacterized protein (TIGR02594 family)